MPTDPVALLVAVGLGWWQRRRLISVSRWLWRWPGRLAWRLLWSLLCWLWRMLARPAWPQAALVGGVVGAVAVVLWSRDATWLAGAAMIAASWTGLWVAVACWILAPQRRTAHRPMELPRPTAVSDSGPLRCRRCKGINTRLLSAEERRRDGSAIGSALVYVCDDCFDIRRVREGSDATRALPA